MSTGRRTSIGFRLSLYVSAITAAVVAVVVAGLLIYAYRRQVRIIATNADRVATLSVPQLTGSVWDYADDRVREQLDDLIGVEHLVWAELVTPDDTLRTGRRPSADAVEHRFDLVHPQGGVIGQLRIEFSLAAARSAVLREAAALAAYTLAPLLLMAVATMLVFRRLVTRHLDALAVYVRSLTIGTMDRAFAFERAGGDPDELDRLREGIEAMRANLLLEIEGRREAESRLDRVEERYRAVFNATGDAIFIHDARSGRILDVNETMLAMYRCTHDQALSAGPDELTAEEQREGAAEAMDRLRLAAAGQPQVFEWYAQRRDGEKFWVEVSLRSMAPADEGLVLAAVRDITARKEAEQRLQQMQRMETVGQLAGGIAHDFNNLLAGILGAAEMIELDAQQAEVREYAQMIVGTTRRAADLTSKLLSYSRRGPVVLGAQDLHEIVADVAAILERSIDKRITLVTEPAAAQHLVNGDRSQLQSAILNLGLNARDAMPEGGVLTIATADCPDPGRRRRGHRGQHPRHGRRHRSPGGRPHLRALLHHQAGRQGHRPGPGRGRGHGPRARRHHHLHQRAGPGHRVPGGPAPGGGRAAGRGARHPRRRRRGLRAGGRRRGHGARDARAQPGQAGIPGAERRRRRRGPGDLPAPRRRDRPGDPRHDHAPPQRAGHVRRHPRRGARGADRGGHRLQRGRRRRRPAGRRPAGRAAQAVPAGGAQPGGGPGPGFLSAPPAGRWCILSGNPGRRGRTP